MSGDTNLHGAIPPGRATIKEVAAAKINLFLHVGNKREDGFHPLQSLAVFTDLGDTLAMEVASGLTLAIDGPFADGLNGEGDNLVLRAARALDGSGAAFAVDRLFAHALDIGAGLIDGLAVRLALRLCGLQ